MTTAADISEVISEATAAADQFSSDAQHQADQAISLATVAIGGFSPAAVVVPDLPLPAIIPTDVSAAVQSAYDHAFGMYNTNFQTLIQQYITQFFPTISSSLSTAADNWVENSITNGGSGLPIAVEQAYWQRDRDRITQETMRLEDEAFSDYASRGFSMPGGVVTNRVDSARTDALNKISESSRNSAVQSAEWALKNTQFAVEEAMKLRIGFMEALARFLGVFATIPNSAASYAETILKAKTEVWDAATRLYSAEIQDKSVGVSADVSTRGQDAGYAGQFIQVQGTLAHARANAAVGAAAALGSIAAATMGANHTMASISST
jgi:hypothetical protein